MSSEIHKDPIIRPDTPERVKFKIQTINQCIKMAIISNNIDEFIAACKEEVIFLRSLLS